jgi:hypothetical protein
VPVVLSALEALALLVVPVLRVLPVRLLQVAVPA